MSKLFLMVAATISLFFTTQEIGAQEETGKNVATAPAPSAEFKEIQISELPKAINDAVTKDFPGATISKAFVNQDKEYQLFLQTEMADKAQIVYANVKGK